MTKEYYEAIANLQEIITDRMIPESRKALAHKQLNELLKMPMVQPKPPSIIVSPKG